MYNVKFYGLDNNDVLEESPAMTITVDEYINTVRRYRGADAGNLLEWVLQFSFQTCYNIEDYVSLFDIRIGKILLEEILDKDNANEDLLVLEFTGYVLDRIASSKNKLTIELEK